MNDITNVFNYGAHEVRTVINDGEPWFVAKDIAEVLGYSNTAKAVLTHIDSDDKTEIPFWDGRQNRNQIVINESGLYSLILRSKLEGEWSGPRKALNDIGLLTLASALVNGYEVEISPEKEIMAQLLLGGKM